MMTVKRVFGLVLASGLLAALMLLLSPTTFAASRTPQASGCVTNGSTIVNVTGTITAGSSRAISSGSSMNCVKTIVATVRNKPGSATALTFVFNQVNCGITGCVTVYLGSIRVTPGNTNLGSFSASPAGLSSTLTVAAVADAGSGADNYLVTVQAYTS